VTRSNRVHMTSPPHDQLCRQIWKFCFKWCEHVCGPIPISLGLGAWSTTNLIGYHTEFGYKNTRICRCRPKSFRTLKPSLRIGTCWSCKMSPSRTLVTVQYLVALSHTVWAIGRVLKIGGFWGPAPRIGGPRSTVKDVASLDGLHT